MLPSNLAHSEVFYIIKAIPRNISIVCDPIMIGGAVYHKGTSTNLIHVANYFTTLILRRL